MKKHNKKKDEKECLKLSRIWFSASEIGLSGALAEMLIQDLYSHSARLSIKFIFTCSCSPNTKYKTALFV